MAKKEKDKLKLISKFLDKSTIKNFRSEPIKEMEDILELPAACFNFLKDVDVKLIKELFNITQIHEFQYLDQESPFEELYKTDPKKKKKIEEILLIDTEIEEKIKKATIISLIAERIKSESIVLEKKEQKVIVVGLGNAGKTTILSKFGGQLGIKDLARLKPTKGVQRKEVKTSSLNLNIWDFGGQLEYRNKYLEEPEKYFLGIDLIIYVIDVQDSELYKESLEYFTKIANIVKRLEEFPYILIFLHKFDPDIKEDNEILLNVEYLKDEIKKIFLDKKKLEYDIYLSSIYSMIAKEPKFAQYLKDTMEQTATLKDPSISKIEGIASILETTLNGLIRLSESVMAQFNEVNKRLANLETGQPISTTHTSTSPTPIYSTNPSRPQFIANPPPQTAELEFQQPLKTPNARSAILQELQTLFDNRKKITKS
ncbi:MAG: GTP-binding protein [Candidatus Lokiarchaeota archaeon]|nr:GTP-binding protein [Candidatus Lokiarchaeota archaeon]